MQVNGLVESSNIGSPFLLTAHSGTTGSYVGTKIEDLWLVLKLAAVTCSYDHVMIQVLGNQHTFMTVAISSGHIHDLHLWPSEPTSAKQNQWQEVAATWCHA